MQFLQQSFSVRYEYKVFFTEHLFDPANPVLHDFFMEHNMDRLEKKILVIIDQLVVENHLQLKEKITFYLRNIPDGKNL